MSEICLGCDEEIGPLDGWQPIGTAEGLRYQHWECALREVLGGIGHLIAHEYWCGEPRHDPDGGLTRRQSSLLAAEWVRIVGQPSGE